jgi:hypothetical protein
MKKISSKIMEIKATQHTLLRIKILVEDLVQELIQHFSY